MIKIINWQKLSATDRKKTLQRPLESTQAKLTKSIKEIINKIKSEGDKAIKEYTQKFDKVAMNDFVVSQKELNNAKKALNLKELNAILFAKRQIEKNHLAQFPKIQKVQTTPGIICERHPRAIEKIGLYIPGGLAPLVSTVLMLGVPASIAKCSLKILCTPPNREGNVHPAILFAAKLCGINKIYKVGGAQAVASMAYGTETIPKVDKIFGPGNSWVTEAKRLVSQDPKGTAIDMPAGPSEVLVIGDKTSNIEFVAADLLSQAEHGEDSQVIYLTDSVQQAMKVKKAIIDQMKSLQRFNIIKESLKKSMIIVTKSLDESIQISNDYAPEHLILNIQNARLKLPKITNAGAVFLGSFAAETLGDYMTGANHVLPTYGYAKTQSGLSLADFMKTISVQDVTQKGFQNIASYTETMAIMEGLRAHANAVSIRLNSLSGGKNG